MTPKRPIGAGAQKQKAGGPAPQAPKGRPIYAALDLGTNSCRMLIARPNGAQIKIVDSFSKSVQLGQGLETSGYLSRPAMARTISALKVCRQKMNRFQVRRMRLVATEACRRARNGQQFIERIRRETGLRLEIISPEEEARLAVISCAPLVGRRTEQLLVVDIGGGSTELVWIDLSDVEPEKRPNSLMQLPFGLKKDVQVPGQPRVVDWISVPLGVATLKDQFIDVEDDAARFALMSWFFEESLSAFTPYDIEQEREGFQIVGTSGTITTVAASFLKLHRYDRTQVDGLRMTSDEIDQVIRSYLVMGPDGRRKDPRIGRERQSLIMSGAAILQTLMRIWPTDRLTVADRGLREGLLYSQMTHDGVLTIAGTDPPVDANGGLNVER